MTRRRPAQQQYDAAAELVADVAARVRDLARAQAQTEREAQAAVARNGEAYEQLVHAWGVLRRLSEALGDSACLSKPVDLAATIRDAELLTHRPVQDTLAL